MWLVDFDPARVPAAVVPLLEAAKRWGIADDGYRDEAVELASPMERRTLIAAVAEAPDDLWDWLTGPEADEEVPSEEYVAISCLTMAYELASHAP